MFIIADRVKQTSITTGTGSITFNATLPSFQTFADAIGDGNTTYYVIETTTQFEIGIGTYTLSSDSLSRDAVLLSSNNGNRLDLTGVSTVFVTYPATSNFLLNSAGYGTSFSANYGGIKFPDGTIQTTAATTSVSKRIRDSRTVSSDGSITDDDDIILVDCSTQEVEVTMPTASSVTGYTFTFKKISGDNDCVILPQSGDSIDSQNSFTIHYVNTSISLYSNGSNWYLM